MTSLTNNRPFGAVWVAQIVLPIQRAIFHSMWSQILAEFLELHCRGKDDEQDSDFESA
jgi:hypothetical protein